MSIPKPNYTQTPNLLFDAYMHEMGEAELKVTLAIVRQTFGYHVDKARITFDDLQELTGLSRQGIQNGVESGLERGTIQRHKSGKSFEYSMVVDSQPVNEVDRKTSQRSRPQPPKPVYVVDHNGDPDGQRSRPSTVNEVDQQPVNEVDRLYKGSKKVVKERKKEQPAPPPSPVGSNSNGTAHNGSYRNTDSVGGGRKASRATMDKNEKAKSLGFSVGGFRSLVDDLLELYGRIEVVDLGTSQGDKYLVEAQEAVLSLATHGYTNVGGFKDLLDSFPKDDWRTRSGLPSMSQLVDRAGEVASGRSQSPAAKRRQQRPSYLNIPEL